MNNTHKILVLGLILVFIYFISTKFMNGVESFQINNKDMGKNIPASSKVESLASSLPFVSKAVAMTNIIGNTKLPNGDVSNELTAMSKTLANSSQLAHNNVSALVNANTKNPDIQSKLVSSISQNASLTAYSLASTAALIGSAPYAILNEKDIQEIDKLSSKMSALVNKLSNYFKIVEKSQQPMKK